MRTSAAALPTGPDSSRPHLRSVVPTALPPTTVRPVGTFLSRAEEAGRAVGGPLELGGLVVDLAAYSVRVDGSELELSPRQIELLALFLAWPGTVWSREQLHWICWGTASGPSRRVDVQLCRLRTRTGLDLFRNVRDRGWALRSAV
jgi:DNA-binding response OmpR family regulator